MSSELTVFAAVAARDLLGRRGAGGHAESLAAAVAWLWRAHDRSPDDGVSYGYCLRGGWRPSYRETSGYITETFFELGNLAEFAASRERALRIARWLCAIQNEDGSVSNPRFGSQGIVFDTGQVLHGLVRAFEETQDSQFLDAAERAGEWLLRVADAQGRWTRNTYLGVPHVYNTRVAWALLRLGRLRSSQSLERVARANLDWALDQQTGGGFENCAFEPGRAPFTHTIAYAIRGLLEASSLLGEARYLEAARRAADAVMRHLRADGFLPGQIDSEGVARARYCCLTGNCQMAIIWQMLGARLQEARYRDAALRASSYVQSCQDLSTANPDLRGGIKGSHPVWGAYAPFSLPNWAAKFFVDALLLVRRGGVAGAA